MAPFSLFGNLRKAMQIKQLILLLGASMLSIASFAQEKKGVESPILSLHRFGSSPLFFRYAPRH